MSIPDSAAVQSARTWLSSGQAPAARAPEVARALLVRDGALPLSGARIGLGADLEMALLLEAEASNNATLVAQLADHAAEKAVAKHAKKVLFRLRQRGIHVPERSPQRSPVTLSARPEPLPSYLSPVAPEGTQIALIGGWRPGDGPRCLMAAFDVAYGLGSVYVFNCFSRTQQRELLGRLRTAVTEFFEVPLELAAGRVRFGVDLLDAKAGTCDGDLAEARLWVADVDPVAEVGFDLDPADEARYEDYLADSGALTECAVFEDYFAPRESWILQHVPHPVGATEAERLAAWDQSCRVGLANWVSALGALSLAAHMEFNAWLLANVGQRDHAFRALACARALREGPDRWPDVAFAKTQFRRAAARLSPALVEQDGEHLAQDLQVAP
ncbi:MAG: hypothetical protein FJ100_15550 [Deltaproteobacteria bacterium]|nr:hypothetical protein [Deltaproteobacteria bacterium]